MKRSRVLKAAIAVSILVVLGGLGSIFWRQPRVAAPDDGAAANAPSLISSASTGDKGNPSEPTTTSAAATNKLFITANLLWHRPIAEEAFARFHDWAEQYVLAAASEKSVLEAEGVELARARREALATLIRNDPERALELAVPIGVRRALPSSVSALLEERVSGRGRLAVLGALPEPGQEATVSTTFRVASLGTREFEAFAYGRRLGEPTRENISLQGIAVDNLFAVGEDPLRILEPEEAAEAKAQTTEAICSVSGQSSTVIGQEVAAEVGGQPIFLCRPEHAVELNDRIVAAEGGSPGPEGSGDPEPSAWTEGQKKLLLIRVDFPDLAGAPLSDATAITLISNLNFFYTEMSFDRAGFFLNGQGSDFTPTFRMPQSASYYGTNNYYNQLRTDARNAATAAGYTLANYNLDVICMGSVPGFGWAGLAYVGAAGAWLRNSFGTGVAGHELGHNLGLNHANYWDTAGQSVIGSGTSVEYGDSFDTMGSASAGNNHFNARYKNYLNWLTANETLTVTSNGIYRVYAHDKTNATTGVRGLRIVKNVNTNYWVELRQKFTSNKWLTSGAGLRWAQNGNQKSHLLDTTPGSTDGKNDSALVIGRTFSDKVSGIHITPTGKGGTTPESLDVVINLGGFPGNNPPTLDVTASATNGATGVSLNFTATASDPDADELAYAWEFGDGSFATSNSPAVNKSWSAAGEYVVRCVASDMKGGIASKALIVVIGSPTTFRISGQVADAGAPVQGARVYVSTTRMAWTESDGTYTIVGLPAGSYTVNASLENYSFAAAGFTNPVSVGPNKSNIDFLATFTTNSPPNITTQPSSQTVNPGANVTFTVVATGSTPLSYQWRFNGANISGATGSSYTRSNVQTTNAGNYSVVVSNVAGTATSANAVLTVNSPPTIATQPQSQSVIAGNAAAFSVTAGGSTPLSYQWRLDGANLAGATASSFTRNNAQPVDAGNYAVVITNGLGSVTSSPASLTVNFALDASATTGGTVTKSPNLTAYAPNSTITLTATPIAAFPFGGWSGDASGTVNPLVITMTTNLTIVANFVSPVADLIVDNPQATFTGNWATDTAGADKYATNYRTASSSANTASATATFTPNIASAGRYDVFVWFPTIAKGAASVPFLVSAADGDTVLNVNQTTGSGGWLLLASGKQFAAGTNGYVRLANNVGQGGKTVVADAVKWLYSVNQSVAAPTILTQPTNQTIPSGASAAFHVAADGTPPLNFQWRFDGANLAGATNTTLALNAVSATDAGTYSVVVSNTGGSVTSALATLTVLLPPTITAQPQSQTIIAGNAATFDATATGTTPLTCQWIFNGASLPGETNAVLALSDVQPTDAGDYYVVITNVAGAATSSVAVLSVLMPPQIVAVPQPQRVLEGQAASFSVTATGSDPLHFQWRFNAAPLAGKTNATLLLPAVQLADAGDYDVTASNPAGAVTSAAAGLAVSVRPVIGYMEMLPDGNPRLTLNGTPGDRYALDATTNLLDWSEIATITNLTGTVQFTDVATPASAHRFYRARLVE